MYHVREREAAVGCWLLAASDPDFWIKKFEKVSGMGLAAGSVLAAGLTGRTWPHARMAKRLGIQSDPLPIACLRALASSVPCRNVVGVTAASLTPHA